MERQYTEKDGTIVTEGDGWAELDFTHARSLSQIVQSIKEIIEKMKQAPVVGAEEEEEE